MAAVGASAPTTIDLTVEHRRERSPSSTVSNTVASATWPAPGLPVARRIEFDAPVGSPYGFDGELLLWHGTSEVARVDIDTGAITTASLVGSDALRAETFYAVATHDSYLLVTDVVGQGVLDGVRVVDPDSLAIRFSAQPEPPERFGFASGPPPRVVASSGSGPDSVAGSADPGLGARIVDGVENRSHWNRGEFWVWTGDGIEVREPDGSLIATLSGVERFNDYLTSPPGPITADEFWITSDVGRLVRIDRRSYEVTHEVDLRAHFRWAEAIRMGRSDPDTNLLLANVSTAGEGWWMLIGIDPKTGVVVSEHVIATDSFDYGWNAFEMPAVASVGDRVFVRDHRRSVVEIDVEALNTGTGQPWTDPRIPLASRLDSGEREVAEATLRFLDPDDESVPLTDPVGSASAQETLKRLGAERSAGDWIIYSAEVEGDRGWARASPPTEDVGAFFVLERIDGVWHIESDGLCALVFQQRCMSG